MQHYNATDTPLEAEKRPSKCVSGAFSSNSFNYLDALHGAKQKTQACHDVPRMTQDTVEHMCPLNNC